MCMWLLSTRSLKGSLVHLPGKDLTSIVVSQCQAIHARTIFPCQDTPDVKSTFDFNITSPLPVIASGLPDRHLLESTVSGKYLYRFRQNVPIPSYLFALASGWVKPQAPLPYISLTYFGNRDISEASIGPRSVVATSPDKLEECKWELEADTEKFINTIEVCPLSKPQSIGRLTNM